MVILYIPWANETPVKEDSLTIPEIVKAPYIPDLYVKIAGFFYNDITRIL